MGGGCCSNLPSGILLLYDIQACLLSQKAQVKPMLFLIQHTGVRTFIHSFYYIYTLPFFCYKNEGGIQEVPQPVTEQTQTCFTPACRLLRPGAFGPYLQMLTVRGW